MNEKRYVLLIDNKLYGEIDMSSPSNINKALMKVWSDFGYPTVIHAVSDLMNSGSYRHVRKQSTLTVREIK